MKRIIRIFALLLCIALVLGGCAKVDIKKLPAVKKLQSEGAIRVAISTSIKGLCQLDQAQKPEGMEPDIARYIAQQVYGSDKAVDFFDVDAKVAGPKLQTGQVDIVIAAMAATDTRRTQYELSKPYFIDHLAMLVKSDSVLSQFGQMSNKKIGYIAGSGADVLIKTEAQKYNMNVTIIPYASYAEAREGLAQGNIDVLCAKWTALRTQGDKKTVMLNQRISELDYVIASPKGNKDMANLMNAIIDDMQKQGMLQSLVQKWELSDSAANTK